MTDHHPTSDPGTPADRSTQGHVPREISSRPPRSRLLRVARWALVTIAVAAALLWAVMSRRREAAEEQASGVPPVRLRRVGDDVAVVLDSAELREAGIQTQTLGSATAAAGATRLTGELVADPARVSTIRAPVPGRLAAPGGHWPALGERVAAGALLAQVSDARPLAAPRAGTVTRLGAQPGEIVQAGQELLQLTDLTAPVARIVWRADAPAPPSTLVVSPLVGSAAGISARLVGPAADVDSLTRAPVYLYRLTGTWAGARPGLAVATEVPAPGAAASGLLVPTDAVVQWQGLAWVYVERGPGQFVRVRVDTSRPAPGGWIVGARAPGPGDAEFRGVGSGDRVVVRGAAQLLSEEFRSRLPAGDEDEGD